jgi:hypothetical protein
MKKRQEYFSGLWMVRELRRFAIKIPYRQISPQISKSVYKKKAIMFISMQHF